MKRRTFVLLSALVLLVSVLGAKAFAAENKEARPLNSIAVFIYSSDPQYRDMAIGMSLYITNVLRTDNSSPLRPFSKLWMAIDKNSAFKTPEKKILVEDIPIVSLDAGARMLIMGRLEITANELFLNLKAHDGVSGALISSANLEGIPADIPEFIAKIANKINAMSGKILRSEPVNKAEIKADLAGIIGLGRAFRLLMEGDSSRALLTIQSVRQRGMEFSPLFVEEEFISVLRSKSDPMEKAWEAEFKGSNEQRIEIFNALVSKNKKNFNIIFAKAESELFAKNYSTALKDVNAAIKLRPSEASAYALRAKIYKAMGNKNRALADANKAIELGSDDPEVFLIGAESLEARGNKSGAAKLYYKAGQLFMKYGDVISANNAYVKAVEMDPKEVDFDSISIHLMSDEQKARLKQLLKDRISKTPDDPFFLRELGRIEMEEGDVINAETHLKGANFLNSNDLTTNMLLGDLYLNKKKDLDAAMKYFKKAKSVAPNRPSALLKVAQVSEQANFEDRATESYEDYLKLNPSDIRVMKHLAQIYLAQDNIDKAIELYERVIEIDPDDEEANQALASLYFKVGKRKEAKKINSKLKKISFGPSKEDEEAERKEEVKQKAKRLSNKKKAPKKLKVGGVTIIFPELVKAVSDFEGEGFSSIAVVDYIGIKNKKSLWEKLTTFKNFDSYVIADQLCKAFATHYSTVCGSHVSQAAAEVFVPHFQPFRSRYDKRTFSAFVQLARMLHVDAIATYGLKEKKSGPLGKKVFEVTIYLFRLGNDGLLQNVVVLKSNLDALYSTNYFVFIIPIGIVIFILLILLLLHIKGFGKLTVKVVYDSRFEQGYFGVRLSKRKLSQAFNVKRAMKIKVDGKAGIDTSEIMKSIFTSWSPFIMPVTQNKAVFEKIPAGKYYLYLTGIMVNFETGAPIGTYEIERTIEVKPNQENVVEINLQLTEAYVEVFVMLHGKRVSGAEIIVDDNQNQKGVSKEEEPVSFYLGIGKHVIKISYEDYEIEYELEVLDTAPKTIEIDISSGSAYLKEADFGGVEAGGSGVAIDDGEPAAVGSAGVEYQSPLSQLGMSESGESQMGEGDNAESDAYSFDPIEITGNEATGSMLDSSQDAYSSKLFATVPDPNASQNAKLKEMEYAAGDLSESIMNDLFSPAATATSTDIDSAELGADSFGSMMEHDTELTDPQREVYFKQAQQMLQERRFEDAVELFLKAGDFDSAAAASQQSGNQLLTYKIYGMSYMASGNWREAAEMFKYAKEPLLEADALERLRMHDEANRLRGDYFMEKGEVKRAVEFYQKSGAWDKVGEILADNGMFEQAGDAFTKAREYAKAAECYVHTGNKKKAAESFELAGEFMKAAQIYKELGSNVKVFQMYEKAGHFLEAAEGFRKFGMLDKAIQAAQQVPPDDENYLKAVVLLAKIFKEKDEYELMEDTYEDAAESITISEDNIRDVYTVAVVAQDDGSLRGAYRLFEKIQKVRYNFADVGERLKFLRARIQMRKSTAAASVQGSGLMDGGSVSGRELPGQSGRYVVIEELGRGAMGVVYKAKDTVLERVVAYKTLSSAIKSHPAAVKYFLSEAKSLAALNHPNIVSVYDIGSDGNNYFIVMEYVEGIPLSDFIAEKGHLSLRNTVVISSKIASGLAYAHEKKVVHRDIKPSNIMISSQGEVKIMDFGLAKIINDAMADKTMARGTPLYMAPEQIRGESVDQRSDIYAFGVTMFEMITGTVPFTTGEITYHHLHTPPPKPSSINPSVPPALDEIILKCLEKEREKRFQSAEEIKEALRQFQSII